MNKEQIQKRITYKNGGVIALDAFNWDQNTQSLSTFESGILIDLLEFDNLSVKTGNDTTVYVGDICTVEIGDFSTVDAGYGCTIVAWNGCNITCGSDCIINAINDCDISCEDYNTISVVTNATITSGKECVLVKRHGYDVQQLGNKRTLYTDLKLEDLAGFSTRNDVINYLIKKHNYTKYLEIGVATGECLEKIECELKDSVDPYFTDLYDYGIPVTGPAKYKVTSDEFFETIAPTLDYKYDIIFIDGLHESQQVDRDIKNALQYLSDNGVIILHDCNPKNELHQLIPRRSRIWNGDVWKSVIRKRNDKNVVIQTIDLDEGLTMIKHGNQIPLNIPERYITYQNLNQNRTEWLNLITPKEFINNQN